MYEAIIAVAGAVYGIFKGTAQKRKATRASVVAFWDPVFGVDSWPEGFDRWLFGPSHHSGPRRAKRGQRRTNAFIAGNQKDWQELADLLGDKFPSMEFWASYLGWPAGSYGVGTGATDPISSSSPLSSQTDLSNLMTSGYVPAVADQTLTEDDKKNDFMPVLLLGAGLFLITKIL